MSEKRKILVQLDSDAHPSVFDRVVAIDAGADEVFSYGGVKPADVEKLVHGCIFTRGPRDLHRTAIFIGGSDVATGEELVKKAREAMAPFTVSVLLDPNGANTTAAAAVLAASRHLALNGAKALVLGGTGPVGLRVALLLATQGAEVRLASRKLERASAAAQAIRARVDGAQIEPAAGETAQLVEGRTLIVAAGAAGIVLLPATCRPASVKMLIDLNAVPPLGIEGVDALDTGKERDGIVCYGALGVGGTKMKLHRKAIAALFEANDRILDAAEVYALGEGL